MKTLKDYSEDIYKCSKCGFCQAVCPIFLETGLETAVSRGKFTLLSGILNNKLKFTKKTSEYLDLCLGCRLCYDFCPSGISAEEIITAARFENNRINGIDYRKKFIIWMFKSNLRLNFLKICINLYKKTGLMNIINYLSGFLGGLGKIISIFNNQLEENVQYKNFSAVQNRSKLKIVYFPGCINNYLNPSAKNAVKMILEKNGFEVEIPKNFSCCGISSRSSGDFNTFKNLAEKNIRLIPDDVDVLLTDCASCGSAWDFYPEIFEGELREKAEILAKKSVNIYKFLSDTGVYIPENVSLDGVVTYHDPCHLARFQHVTQEPRNLLKKIPGLKYVELNDADKCCGAAGTFCVVKPELSSAISAKKAENIVNTEADIVSTSCSACKIGIAQGLVNRNSSKSLISPVELLAILYTKEE